MADKRRPSKINLLLENLSEIIIRSKSANDSWTLTSWIASGSFGDVYSAVSEWNDDVAIKIEPIKDISKNHYQIGHTK